MRLILKSALAVAALGASSAALAAPKDLSGTWLTEDGRAKIRLDKCGPAAAEFCGRVVWLKVPNWDDGTPRTDAKNPDPKKRSRPMIGLQLTHLKVSDEKYAGEIYNADSGKMYQVSMERESASELSVTGCLMSILCGSQTWKKVADISLASVAPTAPKPAAKPASRLAAPGAAPAQGAPADQPEE